MAATHIMSGYGGQYTSESLQGAIGADTIDLSGIDKLFVGVKAASGTPAGTFQMEQTTDGLTWAALGEAIAVDSVLSRFPMTTGPFGLCRINGTNVATAPVIVTLTGFKP